jgi:hypothetical protein
MAVGIPLPVCADFAPTGGACPVNTYGVGGSIPGEPTVPPTACRPYPNWYDMDFVRTPAGRLVVACCPNACGAGLFGQLQVWQYDDADPPNATTFVTLETEDVIAASLLCTRAGTLDLFYLKCDDRSRVWWRESRDGGLTWSAGVLYAFGFAAFPFPWDSSRAGGGALARGLPATYCPQRECVVLMVYGVLGGASAANYVLVGRRGDSGWEFGTPASATAADHPQDYTLQTLRDGTVAWVGSLERFTTLGGDGTLRIVHGTGRSIQATRAAWVDERRGLRVSMRPVRTVGASYHGPHPLLFTHFLAPIYFVWGWECARIGTDAGAVPEGGWGSWTLTGESRTAYLGESYAIPGWIVYRYLDRDPALASPRSSAQFDFYVSESGMLKVREDGVWEFLRPDETGELQFARGRTLRDDARATWDGAWGGAWGVGG